MHPRVILFYQPPLGSITSVGMQTMQNYLNDTTIPSINLKENLYNNL